jgi:hypothetical protein
MTSKFILFWEHLKAVLRGNPATWLENLIADLDSHAQYHETVSAIHQDKSNALAEKSGYAQVNADIYYDLSVETRRQATKIAALLG